MSAAAKYIVSEQPISTGKTAVYEYSYALERRFRFTTRFGDEVELFRRDKENNVIHLPRAVCPVGEIDERIQGKAVHFPLKPTPRPNQVQIFKEIDEFIGEGLSGVVSAYTGFGKTLLGFRAAWKRQVKTLVITTKEDIYQQWVDGAKQFLGCKPWEVGEIRGDKCEVVDTTFCVALIQSLCKDGKYPDWIGDEFGLIIFDECHRVPADYFQNVATMFGAQIRMGLSATPDRKDGKEVIVYTHIGPLRAEAEAKMIPPKILRWMTGWECPRYMQKDPVTGVKEWKRMPHSPGKTAHVETKLMNDPDRNMMICKALKEVYDAKRSVVVFSTRLEHLDIMLELCKKLQIPYKHMGVYKSAATKDEKEERERVKVLPIIFTTFTMMAEGTNLPWLDTAALTMPRSDVRQTVGRITREYEDKKFPVVLDFMDLDSPVFSGYANKRRDWYHSIGAEIVEMS